MSASAREALKKKKLRQKQQDKEKSARERACSSQEGAPEEYYLISDSDPLDIWSVFNAKHASKKIDKAQLIADRGSPRHLVDTAPPPPAERPEVTEAWLRSSSLACPVCGDSQRRTIRTQGAGGWHSVLEHLTKCRHTACTNTAAAPGAIPEAPNIEDAIAGAWRLALGAFNRKKQAREARRSHVESGAEPCAASCRTKEASKETKKAAAMTCRICAREFRAGDTASLAAHETACRARRERQKLLMHDALEATQQKVAVAEDDAKLMKERLTQAQQKLRDARSRGEVLAKERKQQARAEAKKLRSGQKATSYYTPGIAEPLGETKEQCSQTLQKAERAVTLAKKRLDAAHQTVETRKAVAEGVRARAEGEDAHQAKERKLLEDKKRVQEEKKLTFMPASKRATNWQPIHAQKKAGRKQSKEERALAAKTKSEAKKERRNAPREVNDMLASY